MRVHFEILFFLFLQFLQCFIFSSSVRFYVLHEYTRMKRWAQYQARITRMEIARNLLIVAASFLVEEEVAEA